MPRVYTVGRAGSCAAFKEEQMAETTTASRNPIAWLGRFIVFLLSCGYLYPHVCTEGMSAEDFRVAGGMDDKKANAA
jgi:hypothetical protein